MLNNHSRNGVSAWGIVVLILLLFSACSSTKQELEFVFRSTNTLNMTRSGQPTPLVIRVYTLRAKSRFEQATFQELWKHDYEFLGEELIRRKEVTLRPDTEQIVEIEADPEKEEKFIGVMALFRHYQPGQWRRVIPIEEPGVLTFGSSDYDFRVANDHIQDDAD